MTAVRAAARRGPGRPARLSREAIVEGALALLARAPAEPLTLARIAAEVGAVPAALYRHFAGLDALLDAVLGAVLGGVELEIQPQDAWQEQLRDWMTSVRRHLVRFPAVLPLIGRRGRTSPAWLEVAAVQIAILERAGLSGGALARAHLYVTETTVGVVMQEAPFGLPEQVEAARAALPGLTTSGRARYARILPALAGFDGDAFFAFVTDRTLAALDAWLDGRPGRSR